MAAKKHKPAPGKRTVAGTSSAKPKASLGKSAATKRKPAPAKKAPAKKAPAKKTASKTAPAKTAPRAAAASKAPKAPKQAKLKAAAPGSELAVGAKVPAFELLDQDGHAVSSADLAGQAYVIYFYPKDDTPGCTTEACGFRDARTDFEGAEVRVIGVSPDSSQSHKKFEGKYTLPFTLLSDPEHVLSSAYGVWAMKKNYGREYMGVVRSTFLVAPDGSLARAWRGVRVGGHVDEVLAAARELS